MVIRNHLGKSIIRKICGCSEDVKSRIAQAQVFFSQKNHKKRKISLGTKIKIREGTARTSSMVLKRRHSEKQRRTC